MTNAQTTANMSISEFTKLEIENIETTLDKIIKSDEISKDIIGGVSTEFNGFKNALIQGPNTQKQIDGLVYQATQAISYLEDTLDKCRTTPEYIGEDAGNVETLKELKEYSLNLISKSNLYVTLFQSVKPSLDNIQKSKAVRQGDKAELLKYFNQLVKALSENNYKSAHDMMAAALMELGNGIGAPASAEYFKKHNKGKELFEHLKNNYEGFMKQYDTYTQNAKK